MENQNALQNLKQHVCKIAGEPRFIHHKWFVEHHLLIIEQLVAELCEKYETVNELAVKSMVWVHDWGKIITNKGTDEEAVTYNSIRNILPDFGYDDDTIALIERIFTEMENIKIHKGDCLLETKIISSADALAHYIGPFISLYWYENPNLSVEKLVQANQEKVAKDKAKILLPEVLEAALPRMNAVLEFDPNNRPQSYLK